MPKKEKYVTPVSISDEPIVYEQSKKPSMEELEDLLKNRGLKDIQLLRILHGGYMSQVYSAISNGEPVVVKHTIDTYPTDPTSFSISREIQNTDAKVLSLLEENPYVKTPKIYRHFPDITTTVMEDLGVNRFNLFLTHIKNRTLNEESAITIGKAMAHLSRESRNWEEFDTDQSAHQNIYDRGLELRMAYPNSQKEYLEVEQRFTQNNIGWIWVDGTPKNILLDEKSNPAFIDFGLSCFADQQHTLPGFLSHLAVYSLAGIIDRNFTARYISKAIETYNKLDFFDEVAFSKYFGTEILHRSMGKRIPGINTASQKLRILEYGLRLFDDNISTISTLINLLTK